MLAFDDTFISTNKVFAFKVKDYSMKNAGILNGDFVLARRQGTAEPGEILVFIVENEITVKKFDVKGTKVYLIPENDNYQTRIFDKASSEFQIVGKVVGLIRKY
jgi:repressor LexA